MDARERGLRQVHGEVRACGVEGLLEDLLDPQPRLRRVPLAGHEDEAGEEAAPRVAAYEEAHPPALAQVEDAHRDLEELVLADLEELVAGVRLEDVLEALVRMASAREAGPLEDARHLPLENRDLAGPGAVGDRRVEAEEPPLAANLAGVVELLDADVVEVRRAMDRGARVRLRERQQRFRTGEPARLGRELGEAQGDRLRLGLAEDSEPGAGDRTKDVDSVLRVELVLAVAQEGEVVVVHPFEDRLRLVDLRGVERRRVAVEIGDDPERPLAHLRPVLDGSSDVVEHREEVVPERLEGVLVAQAVDLHVDQGLGLRAFGVAVGRHDLDDLVVVSAPHPQHRVDDQVDPESLAGQLHAHRVDEEGHVVARDLDHRVSRLPAVLLELRRVDVHLGLTGRPLAHQIPVVESRPVRVVGRVCEQVLGRDARVVAADELLDPGRGLLAQLLPRERDDALDPFGLSLGRPYRHAPHSGSGPGFYADATASRPGGSATARRRRRRRRPGLRP